VAFNPDEFLQKKGGFNPDAFLGKKPPSRLATPEEKSLAEQVSSEAALAPITDLIDFSKVPEDHTFLKGEDLSGENLATALLRHADTATAGLGRRGSAAMDALIGKLSGRGKSVLPEAEKGIGDLFGESLQGQTEMLQELGEQNPLAAITGDVSGLLNPRGAFMSLFKGASKVPGIAKLLESGSRAKRLGGSAARGGTAAGGFDVLDPDTPLTPGQVGKSTLFGAGGEVVAGPVARVVGKGLVGLGGIGKDVGKGIFNLVKKGADKATFGRFSKKAAEKLGGTFDEFAEQTVGGGTVRQIGERFSTGFDDVLKQARKSYRAVIDPVKKKFGNKVVDTTELQEGMRSKLAEANLFDDAGNLLKARSDVVITPEGTALLDNIGKKLLKVREKGMTFNELDEIVKDFGELARFGSRTQSPRAKVFKDLFFAARKNMINQVENLTIQSRKAGKEFRGGQRSLQKLGKSNRRLLDDRADEFAVGERRAGEIRATEAANLEAEQSIKGSLDDLVKKFEAEGLSAKEALDKARKSISQNIDVAEGPIGTLAERVPEKAIGGAKGQAVGSLIDDAIEVNPQFREPIRNLIVGSIKKQIQKPLARVRGSKASESGVEAIENVRDTIDDIFSELDDDVLAKIFSEQEIRALKQMADRLVKEPGKISKGSSFLFDKLFGTTPTPGTLEALPRTPAPLLNILSGRREQAER
jgi:hypothetical protein